ncbi:MAG: autotransporter outer membrane beta-barrel domain-containing protein [Deltaproteobacteria bacterium]|jgi:hypothetical protein|nr:autotransporter outer membrane beta-barrel domain-containing protein [Deltaproteobacteria bacterium]
MGGLVGWRLNSGFNFLGQAIWVLAISAVLVFGLSWGALANPIDNVSVNGQPGNDSIDNLSVLELGGNSIIPGDPSSGPIPNNNNVWVNGTVDPAFVAIVGGANFSANSDNNSVVVNESGFINGSVYGGVANSSFNATDNRVVINTTGGIFYNPASPVSGNVFGGYVINGTAENNSVTILNGNVSSAVAGGASNSTNGEVLANRVILNGVGVNVSRVYGGLGVNSGRVENNTVIIYNGSVSGIAAGGHVVNGNGSVVNNTITLYNGVVGQIYGGLNSNASSLIPTNVTNNTVIIHGGEVKGNITGGQSVTGRVDYNTVFIDNATTAVTTSRTNTNVIGGGSGAGSATGNNVTIASGANLLQVNNIFGGVSLVSGNVSENLINVATVNASNITGGFSVGGEVKKNQVFVRDSLAEIIAGGLSQEGNVSNNSVYVVNANVSAPNAAGMGVIAGGFSYNGTVENNTAYLENVSINGSVGTLAAAGGGGSINGDVNNNKIQAVNVSLSGGPTAIGLVGGFTMNGTVSNSYAEVSSSVIFNVAGGYVGDPFGNARGSVYNSSSKVVDSNITNDVYGGYTINGTVSNSSTTVSGSNVSHVIYGGYSRNGSVSESSALVMSSNSSSVGGGYSENGSVSSGFVDVLESNITGNVSGGYSRLGAVTKSSALVSKSEVSLDVYGGYTSDGSVTDSYALVSFSNVSQDVYGGYTLNGSAGNNSVDVVSSKATNVTGGYSAANGDASFNNVFVESSNVTNVIGGYSGAGNANNNYVVLIENANVSNLLAGGQVVASGADAYANNTLVLWNYNHEVSTIAQVENFQYYNFYLPSSVKDGFVALQATNVDLGSNASIQWIQVDDLTGTPDLAIGDEIILINATALTGTFADATVEGDIGFFFENDYDVHLDSANNKLTATVASSSRVKDRAKTVTETSAARLAFVTQGQDYLVDQGLSLAKAKSASEGGIGIFAGISGGKSRYETGSHVDLSGINALIGVSLGNYFDQNRLTLGLFGEFGFGSYDSHTGRKNGSVEAEGDVSYVGAGLLGRFDLDTNLGTYYVEASGRIGEAKADFETKTRFNGRRLRFDASGTYVGAHLGTGFDFQVTEEANLDVYVKYLWNRQEGSDERLLGQKFTLDDAESSRVKTGARFSYNVDDFIKPYFGGAYIYEFDGETDGHVRGLSLPNADLKGSSGLAELGLSLLSQDTFPVNLDFGVQGYFGKRQGLAGSLQIKYEF